MDLDKINLDKVNGSFTFKGKDAYKIMKFFPEWCKSFPEDLDIQLVNNRIDFSAANDKTSPLRT